MALLIWWSGVAPFAPEVATGSEAPHVQQVKPVGKSRGAVEAVARKSASRAVKTALGVASATEDPTYFLKLEDGVSRLPEGALDVLGLKVTHWFAHSNTLALEAVAVGSGETAERGENGTALVDALAGLPGVVWAEKGRPLRAAAYPNDPYYDQQWSLPASCFPGAWDITVGREGVVIAVLDSGVAQDIPDLADKIVEPYSTLHETAEAWAWEDVHGHGSGVAGVALAQGDNAVGVAGAAWDVSLMPVHFTDDGTVWSRDFVEAIYYAVDHGADVINISYGSDELVMGEKEAIDYALQQGVVVVAAAGNGGSTSGIQYPAAFPGVIAVTSCSRAYRSSSFSNVGLEADLAAPGEEILAYFATAQEWGLAAQSGTSFASPLVAGAAALLLSECPDMTPGEVEACLEGAATDLGAPGFDPAFGNGLLNAEAALKDACAVSTTTTTAPSTTSTTERPSTTTTSVSDPLPVSPFPDVPTYHPYFRAIIELARGGVVNGRTDGTFGPDSPVMRAQFAKMACGGLGVVVTESLVAAFQDLGADDPASLYPHDYIAAAAAQGIMRGVTSGYFRPWDTLTRAQMLTAVVRAMHALHPGALAAPPAWFQTGVGDFSADHYPQLRVAEYNGLLDGLVGYGPGWDPWLAATRGEVADVLWRAMTAY
ncbi:MAG: S8 family serine peptidase [Gaiellales bacterium]|nr:S8 family serine peptidase [Gaiellales bacterium]